MSYHVPIFQKDDVTFFFTEPGFLGDSPEHAKEIGLGASLVEGVVTGSRYTGLTMEIENGMDGTNGTVGPYRIFSPNKLVQAESLLSD